jgi:peptide deformylase
MIELMRQGQGVGLAGPQVGVTWRLFVCNHTGDPADRSRGARGRLPLVARGHRSRAPTGRRSHPGL